MSPVMSRRSLLLAAGVTAGVGLSACSEKTSGGSDASGSPSAAGASAAAASDATGSIQVLYAGSLVHLMDKQLFPAFQKASGVSVQGIGGGSNGLASQIQGKVRKADVFVSASPSADEQLMGSSHGSWVSWYVQFATSKLVLGYNPRSRFASQITTKPWQEVLSLSGIKVGMTDPKTDPKGKLAYQALTSQGSAYPALARLATDATIVHGEEGMVGQLQAGQLDVGFFYASEAKASNVPTIALAGTDLAAKYTVTIPRSVQNEAGAAAFVKYLLGESGTTILKGDGFTVSDSFTATGSGVPSGLRSVIAGA